MSPQQINRPQVEPVGRGSLDSQSISSKSRFRKAVSYLGSCLLRSGGLCTFTPVDAVRKYSILRKFPADSQDTFKLMRRACSEMTVEQVSDFVRVFSNSSNQKRSAMHRALENGGSALQFVVEQLNEAFPRIPDHSVYASVSLFATHGPLQNAISQRADEVFGLFDGFTLLKLKQMGTHVRDTQMAKGVLTVLLDKPWTRQILGLSTSLDFSPEETVSALFAISELDSSVEAKLESEMGQPGRDNFNLFVRHGLGDPVLSSGQKAKLIQIFVDMDPSARTQTVEALRGNRGISGMVKALPTYWSQLSGSERIAFLDLSHMADRMDADALGALAVDSEGIISQRSLVHEIIKRAGLTKLKQQVGDGYGANALNDAYQSCVDELNQMLNTEILNLKQQGKSLQVPELAQSFLKSEHFKSDVPIGGLSLREALVAVSMIGGPDFDHLPWAQGYTKSTQRKEAIEKELTAQLADSRIGNGDQQSCYEGSIEHVVLTLRPFLDLAPPAPSTQEFFAAFPRVFSQLLQALDRDAASCEHLQSTLQSAQPKPSLFTALDFYQEFEPQIQLLMAREFPSLVESDRKGEAWHLFETAKGHVNELDLPNFVNFSLAP